MPRYYLCLIAVLAMLGGCNSDDSTLPPASVVEEETPPADDDTALPDDQAPPGDDEPEPPVDDEPELPIQPPEEEPGEEPEEPCPEGWLRNEHGHCYFVITPDPTPSPDEWVWKFHPHDPAEYYHRADTPRDVYSHAFTAGVPNAAAPVLVRAIENWQAAIQRVHDMRDVISRRGLGVIEFNEEESISMAQYTWGIFRCGELKNTGVRAIDLSVNEVLRLLERGDTCVAARVFPFLAAELSGILKDYPYEPGPDPLRRAVLDAIFLSRLEEPERAYIQHLRRAIWAEQKRAAAVAAFNWQYWRDGHENHLYNAPPMLTIFDLGGSAPSWVEDAAAAAVVGVGVQYEFEMLGYERDYPEAIMEAHKALFAWARLDESGIFAEAGIAAVGGAGFLMPLVKTIFPYAMRAGPQALALAAANSVVAPVGSVLMVASMLAAVLPDLIRNEKISRQIEYAEQRVSDVNRPYPYELYNWQFLNGPDMEERLMAHQLVAFLRHLPGEPELETGIWPTGKGYYWNFLESHCGAEMGIELGPMSCELDRGTWVGGWKLPGEE
ncbi:MAG TPA: hypothetical protein VKZ99_00600 [Gammaproteobacteria bacterium]|nr:hypothetical protein [Gammaproteobacteria bacterium]